ncbi:6-phosphogluconate dehydrogenase [Xylariales sp. PMI_506]|nr:6-phosphogluconate dehydrogenase [Xylariales sp. PMI_506]
MASRVFFIGLGNMGRGMVKNLAGKGPLNDQPLLVYNRSQKRSDDMAAELGSSKIEVVASPEDGVNRADIIFTCLSNDIAVHEIYSSIIKSGTIQGKLFVDCSTIHPDSTEKTAKAVIDAGAQFVASPVFGAPPMAEAGQLIFVPAGPQDALERLQPYTVGVMGKAEIPMVDKPYGTASKLKLIGNTFVINMVTQLAEALTLAEKTGVGSATVKKFVDGLFGGPYIAYGDRMISGAYHKMEEPLFSADNAFKDADHAESMAKAVGVELRNAGTAKTYLQDVKDLVGGNKGDIASMYGAVRVRSGLMYENDA